MKCVLMLNQNQERLKVLSVKPTLAQYEKYRGMLVSNTGCHDILDLYETLLILEAIRDK